VVRRSRRRTKTGQRGPAPSSGLHRVHAGRRLRHGDAATLKASPPLTFL
jgi:hypothetical protein